MQKIKEFFKNYHLILLLILTLPSTLALLVPGYYGASDDLHVGWLFEMDRVIKMGQIPPRFVPDLSYGFGYPLFNFAFPLPFYIGEIFHLINFSLVDSVKIVFGISLIGSAFPMFFLLRKLTNPWISFIGAILYVYTPYRSTDVYVRGDIGEALSFIFLPLVVLAFTEITTNENDKNLKPIPLGGLSIAGLTLAHNITTYMFLPFAVLFGLMQIIFLSQKKLQALIRLSTSIALGLLISLYFWLPALLDSGLMKYDTVFNFIDHFPTLKQLVTPYWGYGASVPGPGDGMSFFIGIANLIALVLGTILLIKYRKKYSKLQIITLSWSIITFLVVCFLMNFRSSFLWERLPLLLYFQFPWRFLILVTFISPIFLITLEKVKFYLPITFGILALILINVTIFHPHDFLGRMDDYYINRYIPVPKASEEYKNLQEEYLRLPVTNSIRPDYVVPNIGFTEVNPLNFEMKTASDSATIINLNKYLFPGWIGKLDGQAVTLFPDHPYSQIGVIVPPGQHDLQIYFTETIFKKILDMISLVFFVTSLLLISPKLLRIRFKL